MKRVLLFFLVCGCLLSSAPAEIPNGGGPIPAPGVPPVVFPSPPLPPFPCDPIRPAPGLVYTVQGRLTEDCGSQQPLSLVPLELHIKARAGVYTCDPNDPFPQTHTREFFVAAGQTDADGRFSITFLSDVLLAKIPSGYSFLTQLATLQLFAPTGAGVVAQTRYASPDASRVYTIDQDFPACLTDSTTIQVVDSSGDAVIGAEVFINGARHPEKTGSRGFVYVVPAATPGATIVARARMHENQSPRDAHDAGSIQDWNYRVYITSLTLEHDGAGNGVSLDPMAVTAPVADYVLRLDRANAMIGFHLRASVEWDATAEELSVYRQRIIDFSELMYNATDGQFFVEQVELEDDSAYWDETDMRIFATINRRSNARLRGMRRDGGYINLNPHDARISPDTLLHEFGHYGFDLGDEYTRGSGWRSEYGIPVCTHKSLPTAPSIPFENNGPKDACIMRGGNTAANIKICSNHPDNPHTLGTAQGEQDCWTDLADQFRDTRSGSPRWILRTPNTRGEIIGQLPFVNSNGLVPNYTRLAAWQTRVEVVNHQRTDVCVGGLPVPNSPAGTYRYQAILNGVPVNGAEVFLETTYGQWIPQGLTRDNPLVDGTTFRPGEIIIRGAHAGDTLHTQFPGSSAFLTHTITARECDNTGLVIASNGGVETEVLELSPGAFDLAVSLAPTSTFGLHRVLVRTEAALIGAPTVTLTQIGGTTAVSVSMELDPATRDYVGLISNSRNIDAVLEATAVDIDGNSVTQLTHAVFQVVDPAIELELVSDDAGLEMSLPAGAIATPGHIRITRPDDLPPIPAGLRRVAGPYGVQSSTGDALQAPAVLFFPLTQGPDAGLAQNFPDAFEVLEFDPNTQQWLGLDPLVQADPAAVTAETTRLTAYVLAIRTADINEQGFGANGPDEEGDPADPAALLPAAGGGSGVCGSGAAVATPLMLACLCIRTRRRVGPVSR